MKKIRLTLPDGSHLDCSSGVVGTEVVKKIGSHPAQDAIAIKVDDERIVDLMTPLDQNCRIRVLTAHDAEALQVLRHSTAHIMSEAVQALFKGVKVTIGPATDEGFYYDYEYDQGFTPDDLKKIEKKMAEIIKAKEPFQRTVMDKKAAIKKFKEMGENYKVEILEG